MASCVYCKTETERYENGTPICIACASGISGSQPQSDDSPILLKLLQEVQEATDRLNSAVKDFGVVLNDIPSGVPRPDSTFRVAQISSELSTARASMMRANRRLNDFLSRGIIPEDLRPRDSSGDPQG